MQQQKVSIMEYIKFTILYNMHVAIVGNKLKIVSYSYLFTNVFELHNFHDLPN